jgi:DNA-binding MarR family transcriptional regulator
MAPPRRSHIEAAQALAAVAPLATRWIERLLAAHEPPLTVAQYLALRAIAGGQTSSGELARGAGVSGPAVSQLVAALQESGLIERQPAADDRRRQTLAPSRAGKRVYASAEQLLQNRVGSLLADLPRPEADALSRLLQHVEATLAGTPPPRRPPPPTPPKPPKPPRARP